MACAEQPAQVARGRTIDDPGRAANIVGARFQRDVIGKMGLYWARPAPGWRRSRRLSSWRLLIGWFWTVCLFLATTVLGILILRARPQRSRPLPRRVSPGRHSGDPPRKPRAWPMLGGILLLFRALSPTSLGALLLVRRFGVRFARPWSRARATPAGGSAIPRSSTSTPQEWRQMSDKPIDDDRPRKRAMRPVRCGECILVRPGPLC